jgi:hypothetical protein
MSARQRKIIDNSKEDYDDAPDLVPEQNGEKISKGESNGGYDAASIKTSKQPQISTPVPSKLDSFLLNYGKFSASTFTADQGLKVLQWSSWAISYITRTNDPNNHLSAGLNKLYNEMSFTRYALRFYGFFQALEGYLNGSWAGGEWDNALIAKIAKYLMAGSMLLYYPLEHVAYAGWQMPKLVKVDANRYSAISCRFWTAYIVGDFWASCLKWAELKKKLLNLSELLAGRKQHDDKGRVGEILEQQQSLLNKIRHVKLQILRSLLFILPAINWSLPNWATNPMLSEPVLNGLMLTEAYTSVYQSLRAMLG